MGSFEGKLCLLDFRYRKMRKSVDERIKKGLNANFVENNTEIIEKTRAELDEYFHGNRKVFDVPLQIASGTYNDMTAAVNRKEWANLNYRVYHLLQEERAGNVEVRTQPKD